MADPRTPWAIALTMDHGVGLLAKDDPRRAALLRQAEQIHEHHVAPLLREIAQVRAELIDANTLIEGVAEALGATGNADALVQVAQDAPAQVRQSVRENPKLAHVEVGSDADLLRRAVVACRRPRDRRPWWVVVAHALGHGSGVSWAICKALDLDPDGTGTENQPAKEGA